MSDQQNSPVSPGPNSAGTSVFFWLRAEVSEVCFRFSGPLSVSRKLFVRSSISTKSSLLWEQLRVEYEKSMQAFFVVSGSVLGTGHTYFQKIFRLVFVYNSSVSAKKKGSAGLLLWLEGQLSLESPRLHFRIAIEYNRLSKGQNTFRSLSGSPESIQSHIISHKVI